MDAELTQQADRLRCLSRLLVQGPDSEDLVQDAMVAALSQTRSPRRMGPWLRQTLRNRARTKAREETRRRARESDVAASASPASGLEDEAFRHQLLTGVSQALEELEEPYRRLLHARFIEGRTPTEIANEAGQVPATIRWRIHEGIRRLRDRMDDHFEGRSQWMVGLAVAFGIPTSASAAEHVRPGAQQDIEPGRGEASMKDAMTGKTAGLIVGLVAAAGVGAAALSHAALGAPQAAAAEEPQDVAPAAPAAEHAGAELPPPSLAAGSWSVEDDCAGEECYWSDPQYAVCSELMNPANLDQAVQLEIRWFLGPDATPMVSVEATSGCYKPDMCSGIQRPECGEDEEPTHHPEIAMCEEARLLAQDDPVLETEQEIGYMRWLEPPGEECEGNDCPAAFEPLPEPTPGVDELGAEEAVSQLGLPGAGADGGSVTIMECGAYSCFYTEKARETVDQVLAAHPEVSFKWLHFPIETDARASLMARAAVAAHEQGKFWLMHDALFDKENVNAEEDLIEMAEAIGLDAEAFAERLGAPETAQRVADQRAWCTANGVTGTPTFWIDGEVIKGARPFEEFDAVVTDAIEAAGD